MTDRTSGGSSTVSDNQKCAAVEIIHVAETFTAVCECGVSGPLRPTEREAGSDATAHLNRTEAQQL